jgi:hypothetical protein
LYFFKTNEATLSLAEKIRDYTEEFLTNEFPPDEVIKVIKGTFSTLEKDFTKLVECGFRDKNPYMSFVSSRCLICLIWGRKLFAANVEESRAQIIYDKSDCHDPISGHDWRTGNH